MLETVQELFNLTGGVWDQIYVGNMLGAWASAFGIFLFIYALLWFVQAVFIFQLKKFARKTENQIDDLVMHMVSAIKPSLYFLVALWAGVAVLDLPSFLTDAIGYVLLIWVVYQAIQVFQVLIDHLLKRGMTEAEGEKEMHVRVIGGIAKAGLWIFGGILILQNFGIEVTSLIAGLGIGGIAIGLAIQNILSDLFSSFAIYFDKPFVVGDVIKVGEHQGTVEKIGIKTTRLRSPQGEEIIMSNAELTSARIQNFKRLNERRALFQIGVVYDTDPKKLTALPQIIEEVVGEVSGVRFERAHFVAFGDSALMFEIAYYVLSAEYAEFLDAAHMVNLGLHERFLKEGIDMAYPTRVVYMKKEG